MSQIESHNQRTPDSHQDRPKGRISSFVEQLRKPRITNTDTRPDNVADQLSFTRQEIGQLATAGGPDFSAPSPQDNVYLMASRPNTVGQGIGSSAGTYGEPGRKQRGFFDGVGEAAKKAVSEAERIAKNTVKWALHTKAGRWALALTIGGGVEATGVTTVELTDNQPVTAVKVVKEMGTWPLILGQRMFSGEKTPQTFDNSKVKGVIGPSNINVISDLNSISNVETIPTGDNPKHDIYLFTPIKGVPAVSAMSYSKEFTGQNDNHPAFSEDVRQYAKANNIKDSITFGEDKPLPKGTVLISPADGYIDFYRIRKGLPDGLAEAVVITTIAPDGTERKIIMGESSSKLFEPLMLIKGFYTGSIEEVDKFKVKVARGQEILKTVDDDNIINMWSLGIFPSSVKDYPTNINLIATPDPSTQEPKVAILS